MQGTLINIQRYSLGSHRALRELRFGNVSNSLEVIVTGVTEVSGAEAEEDCDRAAVSALVLQVVRPVLGAHLGLANITAASTDELLWVVGVRPASLQVTPSLSSEVSLAALEAHVVGISVHGKPCRVIEPASPLTGDGLTLGEPLVLQPHQRLLSHVLVQGEDRVQQALQGCVRYLNLTNGTLDEAE